MHGETRRPTRPARRAPLSAPRWTLAAIATDDVALADAFSCTAGIEDLVAHLSAAPMHMPGVVLERTGDVRQCQGTALADWVAKGPDGTARGRGGLWG